MPRKKKGAPPAPPRMQSGASIYVDGLGSDSKARRKSLVQIKPENAAEQAVYSQGGAAALRRFREEAN